MRFTHLWSRASILLALTALVGCGTIPSAQLGSSSNATLTAEAVPPQSAFVTIECTVTKLLPDDNEGLPHQNFVVREVKPTAGVTLTCNNDTKYGSKVPGLAVGAKLSIRGTLYHGKTSDGIHWTHKATVNGDAGYIKTADGKMYQ